ncbi:MAG: SseB family protein [Saccharofermentans sp.]|nr:SseB family protein [Saccharofermentans sp.]
MKKYDDEYMNTVFIKEAVEEYREKEDEMNPMVVFAGIISRMEEDGKAPMPLMELIHVVWGLDPDLELEDVFAGSAEPDELFVTVTGPDGKKWLPLFTSVNEIEGPERKNKIKGVPITTILERAISTPGISGIVINPYTDGFAVFKPALEFMLQVTGSGVKIEIMPDEDAGDAAV